VGRRPGNINQCPANQGELRWPRAHQEGVKGEATPPEMPSSNLPFARKRYPHPVEEDSLKKVPFYQIQTCDEAHTGENFGC